MKSALGILLGAILVFSAHIALSQQFTLEWATAGLVWYFEDMDGDSVGELAITTDDQTRFYDGATHNLKWTITGVISPGMLGHIWMPYDMPPTADFTGDGVADIVLHPYESQEYLRIIDVVNDSIVLELGRPGLNVIDFRHLADVDGDGEKELIVYMWGATPDWDSTFVYSTGLSTTGLQDVRTRNPQRHKLNQNYPNPFRNSPTKINYSLQQKGRASIKIYNSAGQSIRTLVNGNKKKGAHVVNWDGTDDRGKRVSSGVYFYQLQIDNHKSSRKAILLK